MDLNPQPIDLTDEYPEAVAGLAELTAESPPSWLRSAMFSSALGRRAAKSPIRAIAPSGPVAGYLTTVAELRTMLDTLDPADWLRPLVAVGPGADTIDGWTIKDLVAHLIAIESYFSASLGLGPWTPPEGTEADHRAMTLATIDARRSEPSKSVFAAWSGLVDRLVDRLSAVTDEELAQRVKFHTLQLPLRQILTIRTFEVWTHVEDVARSMALPAPGLDGARLPAMTTFAVGLVPFGLAIQQRPRPGRSARIVLTGPGGATFDQALNWGETAGEPDVLLVADAVDFCRLAAKRADASEMAYFAEGDVELVDDIFAGCAVLAA